MELTKDSTSWFIGDDDDRCGDYVKFYFTYVLNEENSITVEYNCRNDKTRVACTSGDPYSIITTTKQKYNAILYRMVRAFANGGQYGNTRSYKKRSNIKLG